jgi:hypothetical protein
MDNLAGHSFGVAFFSFKSECKDTIFFIIDQKKIQLFLVTFINQQIKIERGLTDVGVSSLKMVLEEEKNHFLLPEISLFLGHVLINSLIFLF